MARHIFSTREWCHIQCKRCKCILNIEYRCYKLVICSYSNCKAAARLIHYTLHQTYVEGINIEYKKCQPRQKFHQMCKQFHLYMQSIKLINEVTQESHQKHYLYSGIDVCKAVTILIFYLCLGKCI